MSLGTGRLRRADRLLCSREFRYVTRHGKRAAGASFVVFVAVTQSKPGSSRPARKPGEAALARLGITASRQVGNAVARNRVKRRIRDWFRRRRGELREGIDVVVIARSTAVRLKSDAFAVQLTRQLDEADAWTS